MSGDKTHSIYTATSAAFWRSITAVAMADRHRKMRVLLYDPTPRDRPLDLTRLRLITIVAPIAFQVALAVVSIAILVPLLGHATVPGLLLIFAVFTLATILFSFWVFSVVERQQQQLAESAALLNSVTDYAIFHLSPAGRIAGWSKGAELVLGYTAEEIIGEPLARLYLPENVPPGVPERVLRRTAHEGHVETEGWQLRKDGTRFWATISITAVRDGTGRLLGFTHVSRDTTQRRQAEEQVHALNRELAQRVQELAAVNAAMSSISSALDLPAVLQTITDAGRNLVRARYAALGVADEDGRLREFITSGITAEQRAHIGSLPQGHGLLGVLIRNGTPLRVPNISRDPRRHGFPPNHPPMKSLLGVPIIFQGRPVGDLYLTDKLGADEFSAADQELLMLLANHAAVAIENARLFDEVREARDRLQDWNRVLEERVTVRTHEIERYRKEATSRVLQAQESERKRIARELHDDTAQSLSSLLITMDLIEPSIPAGNVALQSGFDRIRALVQRTLDDVRTLSHDLRPTILDDFGLIAALRWYADRCAETFRMRIAVRADARSLDIIADEMAVALFRIAQEALTNSGKHAAASHATVWLRIDGETATLTVADDGKGFDVDSRRRPTLKGGLGVYGMQERADLIGATLTIKSAAGQGTQVTVVVPLKPNAAESPPAHSARVPSRSETAW